MERRHNNNMERRHNTALIETTNQIIMACEVIHNIPMLYNIDSPEIGETAEPLVNAQLYINVASSPLYVRYCVRERGFRLKL